MFKHPDENFIPHRDRHHADIDISSFQVISIHLFHIMKTVNAKIEFFTRYLCLLLIYETLFYYLFSSDSAEGNTLCQVTTGNGI